jgi:sialic acid synthase SpsE
VQAEKQRALDLVMSHLTYVIAEAGACGDADLTKMLAQIDACAEARVDAVKFQWTSDAVAMAKRRGRAVLDGYADVYQRYLTWPEEWHGHLSQRCNDLSLDYMCTVYLARDVRVIAPHVAGFKVSSFEANDTELHAEVLTQCSKQEALSCVSRRQRMILSLGMCSDEEVEALLLYSDTDLLHCVSAYPTPFNAMNLSRINQKNLAGYSDHTSPELTMTGALAVAAGAYIIEAHMKLDTTDPSNPDAPHAMTPVQLADYVQRLRMVEGAVYLIDDHVEDKMRPYRFGSKHG